MGKILDTTYHNTVDKITQFHNDLVNNPFYTLNDKKPTIATYYNINKDYSALDPGSKLAYNNIGKDTPLRFNKITDFILYGFQRIELTTDNDEYGLEADKISAECYILPNTITPTEGDYFEVEHIKDSTWLFIVTDVQQDTLENGSNAYKITYRLEYVDHNEIQKNIVHNYKMIEVREGTNIVSIVRVEDYAVAKKMDEVAVYLKKKFNDLFYNQYVQTYTYMDLYEYRVYDQYMIEFLIRNKILANGTDSYVYVAQQLPLPNTFSIDYEKTLYRVFEIKDSQGLLKSNYINQLFQISSYGTTFSSRYEEYFYVKYMGNYPDAKGYKAVCIDEDLIFKIQNHELVEEDPDVNHITPLWKNILIKYFYDEPLTEEEIKSAHDTTFGSSMEAFYMIPLLIYCLEKSIENSLK